MRVELAAAGAGSLALGVVLFALSVFEQSQASAALVNCYGAPPIYGYPTACTDAMNALYFWGTMTSIAAVVGITGFVLFILGLFLPPEGVRLGPPYAPQYPPPVYAPAYPPPAYPPPQGPRPPPP